MIHIPNYNAFADLIDRLIVCVTKLAYFENKKREFNRPEWIEFSNKEEIAYWDLASRNECEIRNLLKRAIDEKLAELITAEEYRVLPDFRTFRQSEKTIADILAEQCDEIGQRTRDKIAKEYTR